MRLTAKMMKKAVEFLMTANAMIDSTIALRVEIADIAMPFDSDLPILSRSTPACQESMRG
jgi:hypothetical protein